MAHVRSLVSVLVERALLPQVEPMQRDASSGTTATTPPSPAEMAVQAAEGVAERFVADFEAAA